MKIINEHSRARLIAGIASILPFANSLDYSATRRIIAAIIPAQM